MRILLAHKTSKLETLMEHRSAELEALLRKKDPSVATLKDAHQRHQGNLEKTIETLEALADVKLTVLPRHKVDKIEGFDLVVAVGGDGTVLDISHKIQTTPLLGVNSDPVKSVGYFCATDAMHFSSVLAKIHAQDLVPAKLMRFQVAINGVVNSYPILNDILIAHENPAAVTDLILSLGEFPPETQKSSGVWVSTAAGSTAAIRSAGGYVMPLESRDVQYLVREPCPPHIGAYRHLKGIRPLEAAPQFTSRMEAGRVYLDGPHVSQPLNLGDVVSLEGSAPDLSIFGLLEKNRD